MNMIPTSHSFEMEQCYRITCRLMEHPAAASFLDPVVPEEDGAPNYFEMVKNPQDLGTIKERLENKEYTSFEAWKEDVSLVWSNAILYSGEDSAIGLLAQHMYDVFSNLVDDKVPESDEQWIFSLIHYSLKLKTIKNKAGNKWSRCFPINKKNREEEMRKLRIALKSLKEKEDIVQITRIIMIFENYQKIDINNVKEKVDLNILTNNTIYVLILYAKRRFFELSLSYPQ